MGTARRSKPSMLDVTRQTLESDIAAAAVRISALEARIEDLKEEATLVGYDLVSAKADFRVAVRQLETHDQRRVVRS